MVVTPLRWSLVALLAGSVVYEPLRQTVEGQFGQAVGGVGGVGGLTNQWGPVQRTSSTSSGSGALYVSACGDQAAAAVMAYCFHPGVLFGLTPFALVVLCAWVGPLVLGAVLAARSLTPQMHLQKFSEDHPSESWRRRSLCAWVLLSVWWFAWPAVSFLGDEFYRTDVWHTILGIAIPAAFPLSWHLALVAIPTGGFLGELIGCRREDLSAYHKIIGWSTIWWAFLHGGGELVYLTSQRGTPFGFPVVFDVVKSGENLLFVLGALTLVVLIIHGAVAAVRHRVPAVKGRFHVLHRALATVLLLCAASHWWPFALFLIPTTAVHGTAAAIRRHGPRGGLVELQQSSPASEAGVPLRICAVALLNGLIANVISVAGIWWARQIFLEIYASNYSSLAIAFIFPFLAVLLGFISAIVAARFVLVRRCSPSLLGSMDNASNNQDRLADGHDRPLLA